MKITLKQQLIESVEEMLEILKAYSVDFGCDHSVNICSCAEYKAMESAQKVLNRVKKEGKI